MNFNITTILIIANVAASFYAWNKPEIMSKWLMNPYQINRKNEYFRFITSGFIHADYMHLFFNMFTLLSFGSYLESVFINNFGNQTGGILFVLMYILGLLFSDLPSYFKNKDNYNYNSLGASGAISSILFAYILLHPWYTITLFFSIKVFSIIYAVLYVWYSIYLSKKGLDNVNHDAHLYGGLFGVVFMAIAFPGALSGFINQILNWKEYM